MQQTPLFHDITLQDADVLDRPCYTINDSKGSRKQSMKVQEMHTCPLFKFHINFVCNLCNQADKHENKSKKETVQKATKWLTKKSR